MRYLYWVVLTPLFFLLVAFALRNSDPITVRFFLGREWQAPLALVLLVFFCAGVLLTLTAVIPAFYRLRRHLALQRKPSVPGSAPGEAGRS
ncbi:MAG: lipopolysaccharide assembly LapA domain-containing protein [Burkholderiales bacterium]